MDKDWEEMHYFESTDPAGGRRVKLTLVPSVEAPTTAEKAEAEFERLMSALENRRALRLRWRRLIAYALGSAIAILTCVAVVRILFR